MNLPIFGFRSGSIVIGGLDPGVVAAIFVAYVSPQAATILPDDSLISDAAPEKASTLN
jgi:hypothetical protein